MPESMPPVVPVGRMVGMMPAREFGLDLPLFEAFLEISSR
jgi:hypothetical protein